MSAGRIKDHAPVEAPAPIMAEARKNCAARLRARGEDAEADKFEQGLRDWSWAFRHETAKLMAEGERS